MGNSAQPRPVKAMSVLLSLLAAIVFAGGMTATASGVGIELSAPPPDALPLGSLPESARGGDVIEDGDPQVRAHLLVSSGPTPRVGVYFELAPGWHIYWRNPGGTGIAPNLGLEASGHRVADVAWPAPQTFREADGLFTTYGYSDAVLLTAPLIPSEAKVSDPTGSSQATLRAEITALACRTQCVPASFSLSRPMTLDDEHEAERAFVDSLFTTSAASVPRSAKELGISAAAHWHGPKPGADEKGQIELSFEACGADARACATATAIAGQSLFIPADEDAFEVGETRAPARADARAAYRIRLEATPLEDEIDRIRGLARIPDGLGGTRFVEVDLPIEEQPLAAAPAPSTASISGWLQIFFLALLGGLILNGMPCVMPVLAIKVVAVADMADKNPREVRLHGIAYTAGILGSMGLLAAVVIALRAAGHSVGWGFQFQEPLFVAAISAVLVAFALNLFGVFEIEFGQGRLAEVGQEAAGLRRSLFEGLLAVVLATPCTAPFLGTAVGFAFASSGFGIAGIFLAIGSGLASPFLAVSFFPRLARFIPRSGPWMLKLRVGLGFSLLATVLWLLWVLGQTGGLETVIAMATVLLGLAFLLWCFGQIQPLGRIWLGRLSSTAIVGFAIVGFNLIDFGPADSAPPPGGREGASLHEERWLPYSEPAVREALAGGQPAFVVFTADWCITCQVNEKTVLERDSVRRAFTRSDYALFKADWTRRDDAIRQRLAHFGRAGVPLYLVYSPDAPDDPRVLSELLTQNEVLSALQPDTPPGRKGPRMAIRD